jgi:transducin (beta)-like 1
VRNSESGGHKLLQLKGHQGDVFMCVWNPVTKQIASGSADGVCRLWGLWDMTGAQWSGSESEKLSVVTAVMPHCEHPDQKPRDVTSISWSPQGNVLATGCYDGMARIWDQQGHLLMKLKKHEGPLFSLKWNKQGNYVLSGSYDQRAIVWSPETGALVKTYQLHEGPVLDVDWKDNDVFATCSSDKYVSCSTSFCCDSIVN